MFLPLTLSCACAFLLFNQVGGHSSELSARKIAQNAKEQCIKQTNVTSEQAKILYNHAEIPKDDNEKCFMECVYKAVGLIHNGKYNLETAQKLVDLKFKGEENALGKKIASGCAPKVVAKQGEKCSLGRVIRECFLESLKEVDFFPGA